MSTSRLFMRMAKAASSFAGRPLCFGIAMLSLIIWAASGPIFGFNDTWQLIINTATTIITFLMVFLIQNTQNRDTEAMQLKLDELIHVTRAANNELLNLEDLDEKELDSMRERYQALADRAKHARQKKHGHS